MSTEHYVIRGGVEGRERLRVLARVLAPTTTALFDRIGIPPDARCLDVGCGGGDVSFELARRASAGSVLGVDVDEAKLEICRDEAADHGLANLRFDRLDVTTPLPAGEEYDVVYVRFLLTHLPRPADALANLRAVLAPGGVVLVEDIDFTGHFCHPDDDSFWRYVDLYSRAVRSRGCDPDIGPRLPSLLLGAGFDDVGMNVVQPAGLQGEVKLAAPITLEAIADTVLAADLCPVDELERTVDELYAFAQAEGTVLSFPRIVQTWGRRRI